VIKLSEAIEKRLLGEIEARFKKPGEWFIYYFVENGEEKLAVSAKELINPKAIKICQIKSVADGDAGYLWQIQKEALLKLREVRQNFFPETIKVV